MQREKTRCIKHIAPAVFAQMVINGVWLEKKGYGCCTPLVSGCYLRRESNRADPRRAGAEGRDALHQAYNTGRLCPDVPRGHLAHTRAEKKPEIQSIGTRVHMHIHMHVLMNIRNATHEHAITRDSVYF